MNEHIRPVPRPRQAESPVERALGAIETAQLRSADRIRAVARPWYFDVPRVALGCAKVALAPLLVAIKLAEAAVALALLVALGAVVAWHQGYIADKDVVAALKPLGQRLLAMVQSAGTL